MFKTITLNSTVCNEGASGGCEGSRQLIGPWQGRTWRPLSITSARAAWAATRAYFYRKRGVPNMPFCRGPSKGAYVYASLPVARAGRYRGDRLVDFIAFEEGALCLIVLSCSL